MFPKLSQIVDIKWQFGFEFGLNMALLNFENTHLKNP